MSNTFFRAPAYYYDFQCTASKCSDSCCIGWEIDIDEDSFESYMEESGDFGDRLRKNIALDEEGPHFILADHDRCPFLNHQNLCDIFIRLGEHRLCEICTEHPRFYEWFTAGTEGGIGLVCEEAARRILTEEGELVEEIEDEMSEEENFQDSEGAYELKNADIHESEVLPSEEEYVSESVDIFETDNESYENEKSLEDLFFDLRDRMYGVIDNNTSHLAGLFRSFDCDTDVLFSENTYEALWKDLEEALKASGKPPENLSGRIHQALLYMEHLEINHSEWPAYLEEISDRLENTLENIDVFEEKNPEIPTELRRLLKYFLYRYFMKGRDSETAGPEWRFAAFSTLLLEILFADQWLRQDGNLSLEDKVSICKAYSREIEYCEANREGLTIWLDRFADL